MISLRERGRGPDRATRDLVVEEDAPAATAAAPAADPHALNLARVDRGLQQQVLLRLQGERGNAFVQRLLADSAPATIQRVTVVDKTGVPVEEDDSAITRGDDGLLHDALGRVVTLESDGVYYEQGSQGGGDGQSQTGASQPGVDNGSQSSDTLAQASGTGGAGGGLVVAAMLPVVPPLTQPPQPIVPGEIPPNLLELPAIPGGGSGLSAGAGTAVTAEETITVTGGIVTTEAVGETAAAATVLGLTPVGWLILAGVVVVVAVGAGTYYYLRSQHAVEPPPQPVQAPPAQESPPMGEQTPQEPLSTPGQPGSSAAIEPPAQVPASFPGDQTDTGPLQAGGQKTQWGWRGSPSYNDAVREIAGNSGTLESVLGKVPTEEEAAMLIEDAGGTAVRVDPPHEPPNPHQYPHINYDNPRGQKATVKIQS